MTTDVTIKPVIAAGLQPYIDRLAQLRIAVFREYPYLYQGSLDYEAQYLGRYLDSATALTILAIDDDRLVGASTGMPLIDADEAFRRPFIDGDLNLHEFFYCGESILLPAYRGRGIYRQFIRGREDYARSIGCRYCCFCAVQRAADHPLQPPDYQPLDAVWHSHGYRAHPELIAYFDWQDINESQSSAKPMMFWLKELAA